MATAAPSMAPRSAGITKEERRVIFASSLGTVFEWYDFYLYGSLAAIIAKQFFSGVNPTAGLHLRAARVRGRLRGAAVRRAGVRAARRSRRTQVHVPGHDPDHGLLDVHRRLAAVLCVDRHRGAGHPHRAAPAAGPGARRRIRRCGDVRRGARAGGQARRVHELDPDHGDARPVPVADRDPRVPRSAWARSSTTGAGAFRSCCRWSC